MKRFRDAYIRISIFLSIIAVAGQPARSNVWVADNGDGTYKNPILYADYSDPDVTRVGEDYYMTASSFTCMPGLPILHSKDLVNWTLIGHALKKHYPEEVYDIARQEKGVWAPCIRFHDGSFYIYWGDPDFGIQMVKATDPAGDWSKPVMVKPGKGLIDPSPLWDDDGRVYLVHSYAYSRAGVNALLTIHRMNSEGTQVIDEGKHVFDGHDRHPTLEGPKFYTRHGYYYVFAPGGGVPTGWQVVLRARDIWGPYEDRIVLAQGNTPINGPHQGGWVETPSGESWFIHFQEAQPYGRIVHLQPVQWIDDWPVMGIDSDGDGTGEPVLAYPKPNVGKTYPIITPAESDEFNGDRFGLQWQWNANPRITWFVMLRNTDYLRLFASEKKSENKNLWDVPNLLLQKFPAPSFTATTKLTFTPQENGKHAGLIVMGRDYAFIGLSQTPEGLMLKEVICKGADKGGEEKVAAQNPVQNNILYLRVYVSAPKGICRFARSLDGEYFEEFGETFPAREGGWIGAKVGLFCVGEPDSRRGGYADFDWFRIE